MDSCQCSEKPASAFKNTSLLPSGAQYTIEVEITKEGSEYIQSYITYPDGNRGCITSCSTQKPESFLSQRFHCQKFLTPHPNAGSCFGPVTGECPGSQQLITCVCCGNTKKDIEDYLNRNCTDSRGNPKKC